MKESGARKIAALFEELASHASFDTGRARRRGHLCLTIADALAIDPTDRFDAIAAALLLDGLTERPPTGSPGWRFDPAGAIGAAEALVALTGLNDVARIVAARFEHFDGGGGPHGTAGDDIPIAARVLAVADFATAVDPRDRVRHLSMRAGVEFDPRVVAAYSTPEISHDGSTSEVLTLLGCSPNSATGSSTAAVPSTAPADATTLMGSNGHPTPDLDNSHEPGQQTSALASLVETLEAACSFEEVVGLAEEAATIELGGAGVELIRFTDEVRHITPPTPRERIIRLEGRDWGILRVGAHPDIGSHSADSDAEVEAINAVAQRVSDALIAADQLDNLAKQALLDPLTGVGNRRVLEARLADVFELPHPERAAVAMIIADVDGLKRINDTLGHDAGDQAIRLVASALIEAITGYPSAVVCRIGGDEFCVVLEDVDAETARTVANVAAVVAHRLDAGVQLSCGVAMAGGAISTAGDLLRAADLAQYQAKRDRAGTVIYDNGYPPPLHNETGRRSLRDRH